MADYMNDGKPQDYTEIIEYSVFLGDVPFATIKENIQTQFEDYINMEDKSDYVDTFYTQWKNSMESIEIGDDNPDDRVEVLNNIKDEFVSFLLDLFEKRLAITITVVDNPETDEDELELAFRRLYEFFILHGREYLKYVITTSISRSLKYVIEDDSQFYNTVSDMLTQYSPLLIAISPLEYIKLVNEQFDADDVQELFETSQITGNFLRKYSPKLYKNEDFECEIISAITLWDEWNKENHTYEENVQFSSFIND